MDAGLLIELVDRVPHLATREVLDDLFEGGVLLPHDVIEPHGLDAGLLELLIGSAGFDSLVLADIAHEQDAVLWLKSMEKLMHLPRARETGFVEDVEARLFVALCFLPYQMPL